MSCRDQDVVDLAGEQDGVVSLAQLRGLGCTRAQRRRLLEAGTLRRVAARVYASAGTEETFEHQLRAALLSLGPTAVVSHLAAARLHGLTALAGPEFTVARSRRNATGPFRVHATDRLGAAERCEVGGFPCTTVVRTVLDVAATDIDIDRLGDVVDRAVTARDELRAALQRRQGRGTAGMARLRTVLREETTPVDRRFLSALRDEGLPRPVRVAGRQEPTFRFPATGLTVTVRPAARDWPAIARTVHRALREAGWSGDPELGSAA